MRKHHDHANGIPRAAAVRDWLALTELGGHSEPQAAGWLCFCVCHALNAPSASDRPADLARAERSGQPVEADATGR
ncbi:hypothetical protein [Streptomyces wuyuanensis]|uniref:hypothetical protein n=1 Tax=Streptomyces wuyuanensis TaxID=1196353 RepID=UPI00343CDB13